jgi:hypothetical protein
MSEAGHESVAAEAQATADQLEERTDALGEQIDQARETAAEARQPDLPGIVQDPDGAAEVNATYPNKRPAADSE